MPLFRLENRMACHKYDVATGFIIRASKPSEARNIAALHAGDEGPEIWFEPAQSTCTPIHEDGPAGIILRAFQNG